MGVMTKSIEKKLWDTACDLWVNAKIKVFDPFLFSRFMARSVAQLVRIS